MIPNSFKYKRNMGYTKFTLNYRKILGKVNVQQSKQNSVPPKSLTTKPPLLSSHITCLWFNLSQRTNQAKHSYFFTLIA